VICVLPMCIACIHTQFHIVGDDSYIPPCGLVALPAYRYNSLYKHPGISCIHTHKVIQYVYAHGHAVYTHTQFLLVSLSHTHHDTSIAPKVHLIQRLLIFISIFLSHTNTLTSHTNCSSLSYPTSPHFHFYFSLAHKHTHLTHKLLITVLSSASSHSFLIFSLAHTHTHTVFCRHRSRCSLSKAFAHSFLLLSLFHTHSHTHTPCSVSNAHDASYPKPPNTHFYFSLALARTHTPCYVGSAHAASCPKPPHIQPPTAQRHNITHTRHTRHTDCSSLPCHAHHTFIVTHAIHAFG